MLTVAGVTFSGNDLANGLLNSSPVSGVTYSCDGPVLEHFSFPSFGLACYKLPHLRAEGGPPGGTASRIASPRSAAVPPRNPASHRRDDPLYGSTAIQTTRAALKPGGVFAVWGEDYDAGFATRLTAAGFGLTTPRSGQGGSRHMVYLGRLH